MQGEADAPFLQALEGDDDDDDEDEDGDSEEDSDDDEDDNEEAATAEEEVQHPHMRQLVMSQYVHMADCVMQLDPAIQACWRSSCPGSCTWSEHALSRLSSGDWHSGHTTHFLTFHSSQSPSAGGPGEGAPRGRHLPPVHAAHPAAVWGGGAARRRQRRR